MVWGIRFIFGSLDPEGWEAGWQLGGPNCGRVEPDDRVGRTLLPGEDSASDSSVLMLWFGAV